MEKNALIQDPNFDLNHFEIIDLLQIIYQKLFSPCKIYELLQQNSPEMFRISSNLSSDPFQRYINMVTKNKHKKQTYLQTSQTQYGYLPYLTQKTVYITFSISNLIYGALDFLVYSFGAILNSLRSYLLEFRKQIILHFPNYVN